MLGGRHIGLEFAQMFRRFGSRVTGVQRGPQLLAREDRDTADAVAGILREDGIDVRLAAAGAEVRVSPGGSIRIELGPGQGAATLLLVEAERTANTEELNLGAAGVETDARGFIRTDERLETSAPGVYAVGDVKGGPAFTHLSYDAFRVLRTNLLGGGGASTHGRPVPYVVFIDPQLGRVGSTEQEAIGSGRPVGVARLPMANAARPVEVGETRGVNKAVVDLDDGRLLGCVVLAAEGGELMSLMQVAMMGGLPPPRCATASLLTRCWPSR